jgi:hypothetical protein
MVLTQVDGQPLLLWEENSHAFRPTQGLYDYLATENSQDAIMDLVLAGIPPLYKPPKPNGLVGSTSRGPACQASLASLKDNTANLPRIYPMLS